ncbi:uncharacterized protein LOC125661608 [Ostrea edulis]|uniref:uncharacterized protein LOC125661608 n=1 Tax=Ostrea edulis TaxID=37623 RepID=UPI0024AEFF0E|nr:uncharacterized protein LOC125661608 [Ostrea edulis]
MAGMIVLIVTMLVIPHVSSRCEFGRPLPYVFCGRGPSRQNCPSGYTCNIDSADKFGVCCREKVMPECEVGHPLPNVFCGRDSSSENCPQGYYCNIDPTDRFAVCCRYKDDDDTNDNTLKKP